MDGKGGLNDKPNTNLNYVVTGMNNIRFIPCSPELTILPSVFNFRRALARTCNTPYTVSARFTPITGSASVIDKLPAPFDSWFKLADLSVSDVIRNEPRRPDLTLGAHPSSVRSHGVGGICTTSAPRSNSF